MTCVVLLDRLRFLMERELPKLLVSLCIFQMWGKKPVALQNRKIDPIQK